MNDYFDGHLAALIVRQFVLLLNVMQGQIVNLLFTFPA